MVPGAGRYVAGSATSVSLVPCEDAGGVEGPRRRHTALGHRRGGDPGTLERERVPMPVEKAGEPRPLVAGERGLHPRITVERTRVVGVGDLTHGVERARPDRHFRADLRRRPASAAAPGEIRRYGRGWAPRFVMAITARGRGHGGASTRTAKPAPHS